MGRINIALDNTSHSREERRGNKDWRQIIPGLVISGISLIIVLYLADIKTLAKTLSLADFRFVLLGFLTTLLWLVVRGFAWRTLLQEKAPYPAVFWTLNEGYLLNNLLPLRLGEIARALLLSSKTSLGFWEVVSSILIERAVDLALAVGLLFITLPLVVGSSWAQQAAVVASISVLVVFFLLYLLARNREWALTKFGELGVRWPLLKKVAGNAVPSFLTGLGILTDKGRFIRALAWMILNWVIAVGQYYLVMSAYISDPKFLWAAFGIAVAALGIAVPSSPGAVGVLELSIVGSLSLFGVDPSIALAFAFTIHFIQYLTTGVLGAYALARDGESLMGLYNSLRNIRAKGGKGEPTA